MKSFLQFIKELNSPSEEAQKLGLQGDGHGSWYDRRTNEFVAKTEGGKLKFYNKRERIGQQDPRQTAHEKMFLLQVIMTQMLSSNHQHQ